MEIRKNIFVSVMIHAMIIASVIISGSKFRDTAFRVPSNCITVSMFKETGITSSGYQKTVPYKKDNTDVIASDLISRPQKKKRIENNTYKKEPGEISPGNNNGKAPVPEASEKAGLSIDVIAAGEGTVGELPRVSIIQDSGISGISEKGMPAGHFAGKVQSGDIIADNTKAASGKGVSASSYALIRAAIEKAKTYPILARKKKIEGTVITEFAINAKGFPENVRVRKSSGHEILDSAALNIISKAAPFPQIKEPIEIPITFSLTNTY